MFVRVWVVVSMVTCLFMTPPFDPLEHKTSSGKQPPCGGSTGIKAPEKCVCVSSSGRRTHTAAAPELNSRPHLHPGACLFICLLAKQLEGSGRECPGMVTAGPETDDPDSRLGVETSCWAEACALPALLQLKMKPT